MERKEQTERLMLDVEDSTFALQADKQRQKRRYLIAPDIVIFNL